MEPSPRARHPPRPGNLYSRSGLLQVRWLTGDRYTRPEVSARLGAALSEFDAQHGGARALQPATA